ncbi:MAG TPA: IPTL-CTERM sorting domain-containing protein [Thermoanaerobaculia bacterium]|nr:IPTL-CTERM sorting domain-containing protein [Thermoanaerobaculia bacterium]
MKNLVRLPLAALALLSLLAAAPFASAQTVVHPGDLQGWLIGPFGTPPSAGFEAGPGMPPFGDGSYGVEITDPNSKIILVRNDYHDLPLAGLTAFSFWTWIDPMAANVNNWYVNLYFDTDGDGMYDGVRLDYVPPAGMVMTGVWQQWDAFLGTWNVNTGGTSTLAAFLLANPNARFNAFSVPEGGAVRFNQGDTASNYVGFVGNLDGVRIAHVGVGDDTWDFELAAPADPFAVPTLSPVALAALALLLAVAAAWTLRRRRVA